MRLISFILLRAQQREPRSSRSSSSDSSFFSFCACTPPRSAQFLCSVEARRAGPPPFAPANGRPGFPFGFLAAGGRLPRARRGRVFIVPKFSIIYHPSEVITPGGKLVKRYQEKEEEKGLLNTKNTQDATQAQAAMQAASARLMQTFLRRRTCALAMSLGVPRRFARMARGAPKKPS